MKWFLKRKSILVLLICFIAFISTQTLVHAESTTPDISFTIVSPSLNSIQYDDLKVVISKPKTIYQVSEVKAKVDGRETNPTYDENAYFLKWGNNPGWIGHLNLAGLTRGEKTLEITVKDVQGNSVTNQITFKYTQPPSLTIHSPLDFDFSNGKLKISAEATDLAGENSTIKVYASSDPYGSGEKIFESSNVMDTIVDLSKYSGQSLNLRFEATNETGGSFTVTKSVTVDTNPLLNKVYQVNGQILDFKDNILLYKTTNNQVKIKDLQTSYETLVFLDAKNTVDYGYLTSTGAMIAVKNVEPYYICDSLFEFKNNDLTYLGRMNSNTSLKVNGHYAIWSGDLKPISTSGIASGNELYLIDLDSDRITLVSNQAGNWMNDVTSNGDVIYWSSSGWSGSGDTTFDYNVYKYSNGITSKLSSDSSYFNVYPLSNGKVTVYEKHRYNESKHSLILNVDGRDETLATTSNDISPSRDYTINNNFVAYTKTVNGTKQIFLWKEGVSKQLTYAGSDANIVSLSENGDIVAGLNNGYYLIKNDGSQPFKITTIAYKNYWVDSELYGNIDGSILKINTNPIFVTGITLSETQLGLQIGEQHELLANLLPSNATNQNIKWFSSNSDIVTVDNTGKVTAKKEGTASIIATTEDGNMTASCTVKVKDITPPDKPIVNQVTDQSTSVTGTAESGSVIEVENGASVIGTGTTGEDGAFSIMIPVQTADTQLSITATDQAGNVSEATVVVVKETEIASTDQGNGTGTGSPVTTEGGNSGGINGATTVSSTPGVSNSAAFLSSMSNPSVSNTQSTNYELSETATNTYNLLGIGILLIILGSITYISFNRRKYTV